MYPTLLVLHSFTRWLVLMLLVYSIYRSLIGMARRRMFSPRDDAFRHWTATAAHIQLVIGILLYTQSPVVSGYWAHPGPVHHDMPTFFFAVIHMSLMLISIVVLTIGSALVKRKVTDKVKFRAMSMWFSVALILLLIAIPWPFSPLAARPYLRTF